jgi:hypothetical protein
MIDMAVTLQTPSLKRLVHPEPDHLAPQVQEPT